MNSSEYRYDWTRRAHAWRPLTERDESVTERETPRGYAGPASLRAPKLGVDNMRVALRKIAGTTAGEPREIALRALAYDKRMRGGV